jgi:hypothetical protein
MRALALVLHRPLPRGPPFQRRSPERRAARDRLGNSLDTHPLLVNVYDHVARREPPRAVHNEAEDANTAISLHLRTGLLAEARHSRGYQLQRRACALNTER